MIAKLRLDIITAFLLCWVTFTINAEKIKESEVLRWPGGAKAAICLTFDDNLLSQLNFAIPKMEKYGYRGTFFIVAQWIDDQAKWDGCAERWKKIYGMGHEIGCHSYSHNYLSRIDSPTLSKQTSYAKEVIERWIGKDNCQLFRFPWGNSNEKSRNAVAKVFPLNAVDLHKYAKVYFTGATSPKAIIKKFDQAIADSGIAITVHHGVGKDFVRITEDGFDEVLEYLAKKGKDAWIAPQGQVIKYAVERSTCKVTFDDSTITISLPASLDSKIFNQPLWIRTPVSKNCKFARIISGKRFTIVKTSIDSTGAAHVVYPVMPDGQKIQIVEMTEFNKNSLIVENKTEISFNDKSDLTRWKIVDGEWNIADGVLVSGKKTSKLILEKKLKDFRVTGKFRSISNGKQRIYYSSAGFYIRSEECLPGANNGKYYCLENHSSLSDFRPNRILLWDQKTSRDATKIRMYCPDKLLSTFECNLPVDTWHNFELIVIGNKMEYKVDGKAVMISDEVQRKSGNFGLVNSGTKAEFDNITITELKQIKKR